MTRMIRGSVLLAACVGLWSCSSNDPTASEAGVPYKIVSLPSVIFITVDSSTNIGFQLVDALDGQIPSDWTIGAAPPEFQVTFDSTFRPIYNSDGTLTLPSQQTEVRATITGLVAGKDSFLVTASGKSLYIPVQVVPGSVFDAKWSNRAPQLSDTVLLTPPVGMKFTDSSQVTLGTGTAPYRISVAPDGSSIRMFVAANSHGKATVTKVTAVGSPTLRFTYTNVDSILAQTLTVLPATFSTLAPAGTPVTMTMNAGFQLAATSAVTFPTTPTPLPIINSRTDSTSLNMSVGPNINSPVRVTLVHAKNVPQLTYTLNSAANMVSPVVTNFPGAISNAAPVWGDTVTVSITGGGYKFSPTSAVNWGATKPAFIVSRAPDSLSIRVIPLPGSSGVPSVTLVSNASYAPFTLTLPGSAGATMAAVNHTSTAAIATAPLVGNVGFYYDAGTFGGTADCADFSPCQIYKINPAVAANTFTITWAPSPTVANPANVNDLGLYFMDASGNFLNTGAACDAKGNTAAGQPETCTATFPAGTNYLELDNFGPAYPGGAAANPAPVWVAIRIN